MKFKRKRPSKTANREIAWHSPKHTQKGYAVTKRAQEILDKYGIKEE